MIKHIVIWKLKDTAHGNDRATNARLAKEKLETLQGRIPGLLKMEIGLDIGATADGSDLVLYSEFDSRESLAVHAVHPLHQAIVPFVAQATIERRVVDYEV